MPNPIKLITAFGSATFLAAILSATVYTSTTNASSLTIHSDENGNNIRIYHEQNEQNRVYEVNGKKFYWKDLNPEQQLRITKIEARIEKVESRLRAKEVEMRPIIAKLEVKARAIEKQMEKINLASIKVDKTELNMRDVEKLMEKLEAVAQVNEKAVEAREVEMEKLEHQLEKFDSSFSVEIDQHVEELEALLLTIADKID